MVSLRVDYCIYRSFSLWNTSNRKYLDYYNISYSYLHLVMERTKKRFAPEDLARLEDMLRIISNELMPEIPLPELKT